MATLASRIQERASQFISEQAHLQSLQAELGIATSVLTDETKRTQECVRSLLDVSHDRFGIERKICDINQQIEAYSKLNTSLRTDTQRLEESARIAHEKLEDDINNVFAPHDSNIAVYCQALDSAIARSKRRRTEDKERCKNIQARIAILQIEEEQYWRETSQLETDINRLEVEEIQSDRVITSLGKKVQDSLSKVASLTAAILEERSVRHIQ
ncbi:unnamed protein product [Cylindrotheca closterium]|uniref:Uncharacterized protein n=1 Tax=Cylindrotheca closterium TaxID=2856 RepID=A0AAD2FMC0_9STRA|nr:unnamed protein product [Cylindrotheca closterium]